ncbi:helix-turn-helix transcriptional regulator [Litoribacter ruber]|uniref:helix-turn-helix transcriptional regulator n=1 Tax=Litoribacter ruber TaxID=702568 RepID=UPI001BDA0234|nr:helix-turn-helix transcriptional regulator [Litoribacter ruber]MBT0813088.1 helix-turn-helix transcriptional regulator [Litoribacter ruber]
MEGFAPYYLIFATLIWGLVGFYILYVGKRIYFPKAFKRGKPKSADNEYFTDLKQISLKNKYGRKIHSIMAANLSNPNFSADHLARELRCSLGELHSIVTKLMHQTPEEYIVSSRMKKAAFLLKYNFGNVDEISRQVGYRDHQHFAINFKKYFGLPPREYLKFYKDSGRDLIEA